jgi:hypothetical protein
MGDKRRISNKWRGKYASCRLPLGASAILALILLSMLLVKNEKIHGPVGEQACNQNFAPNRAWMS